MKKKKLTEIDLLIIIQLLELLVWVLWFKFK